MTKIRNVLVKKLILQYSRRIQKDVWQRRSKIFAYLNFFRFYVFVSHVQFAMFLCPLHGFPLYGFSFTTLVYYNLLYHMT